MTHSSRHEGLLTNELNESMPERQSGDAESSEKSWQDFWDSASKTIALLATGATGTVGLHLARRSGQHEWQAARQRTSGTPAGALQQKALCLASALRHCRPRLPQACTVACGRRTLEGTLI